MKHWLGAVVVAGLMAPAAPAAAETATATTQPVVQQRTAAIDVAARRRLHRHRHGDRRLYQPTYYDRPYGYRPYPYTSPVPFTFGFGFGPPWP